MASTWVKSVPTFLLQAALTDPLPETGQVAAPAMPPGPSDGKGEGEGTGDAVVMASCPETVGPRTVSACSGEASLPEQPPAARAAATRSAVTACAVFVISVT